MDLQRLLCFSAALTTALMAGLFFAWSCSVVPGLARLPDAPFIAAMQSMNRAIQNPLFFLAFLGAAVALPLCAWLAQRNGAPGVAWLWAAAATYWVGVMGPTFLVNVPLNDMLNAFDPSSASAERMARVRAAFAPRWNFFNGLRTWASVIALVFLFLAWLRPRPGTFA